MKKILLLGGSAQQVIAIEKARKLGYYTILCDYLADNPGQYYADKFYLISTTDKIAVLKVALCEQIDGILAYASDPAAPTAAYVAEKIGLPSNPYKSVETLCNKDRFRTFLQKNGFNTPQFSSYDDSRKAKERIKKYNLPVIVKPVDSSGSKGVTILSDLNQLDNAVDIAFSFSRSHRIIIEEFIVKKHHYLIGGDIFVENGQIVLWGLLNCHRDNRVNLLVPTGKSYPLKLNNEDMNHVKTTLQDLVDMLHIKSCGMNIELVIDKQNKVWLIDVGPRNGGNMIPDLLGMIFGVDVVEMAVQAAMGVSIGIKAGDGIPFYATHNLHTAKNGIYQGIEYSEKIEKYIIKKCEYKKPGDKVEYFDNAAKALGIIFLKFNTQEEMTEILENINTYITVKVAEFNNNCS